MCNKKTAHRHIPELKSIDNFFTTFPWLFGKTFVCGKCGASIRPKKKLRYTVINILWGLTAGKLFFFIQDKLIGLGSFADQILPRGLCFSLNVVVSIILIILAVFVIPAFVMKYFCEFEEVLE